MVLSRAGHRAGFCSGVIIGKDTILTAAHCVTRPADMRIFYRDHGAPVMLPVRQVRINPGYHANARVTRQRTVDLALVESAAPLPARYQPAVLASSAGALPIGQSLVIAGYGMGTEGVAQTTGTLRLGIIELRAPLSKVLLWAKDRNHSGVGACEGDSGSPIFAQGSDAVLAITAWADGRGHRRCGAFTQGTLVAPQRGWIMGVMRDWGQN